MVGDKQERYGEELTSIPVGGGMRYSLQSKRSCHQRLSEVIPTSLRAWSYLGVAIAVVVASFNLPTLTRLLHIPRLTASRNELQEATPNAATV